MTDLITRWLGESKPRKQEMRAPKVKPNIHPLSTGIDTDEMTHEAVMEYTMKRVFLRTPAQFRLASGSAIDENAQKVLKAVNDTKTAYTFDSSLPDALTGWYANQSFIGYQMCAILAQNAVIDKCCSIHAKDAIRKGYEITENSGTLEISPEVFTYINMRTRQMKINRQMVNFVRFGKMFGIRHALFKVNSTDPKYYEKPFNIDGITPNSYKGIVQIDPYWLTPELTANGSMNPMSEEYYKPTYWRLSNGQRIHHSHFCIYKTGEVADILKPTYFYGGVSIPQKIYERVYAAESTANEAPQLAKTKRSVIYKMDLTKAVANQKSVEQRLTKWMTWWNNWSIRAIGQNEEVTQTDTSLTDLDAIIMTQYQLICMLANAPSTKIMGTSPKGFNATGEYEEANYREELESTQENDLDPILMRHIQCLIRSEVKPKFNVTFDPFVKWFALDSPTAKELADTNLVKAQTAEIYVNMGAVDAIDVHNVLVADEESGYNGILSDTGDSATNETDQTAQDVPLPQSVNQTITNLSAAQHQQIVRTLRDFKKERIDEPTATSMLSTGFGFTPEQITAMLGLNKPQEGESDAPVDNQKTV